MTLPFSPPAMSNPPAPRRLPRHPLKNLLFAIAEPTRWRILDELFKEPGLPIVEIARRLKAVPNTISKHVAVLRNLGIITHGYGYLYRIHTIYLVPGQRALDLGAVVLRLDHVND